MDCIQVVVHGLVVDASALASVEFDHVVFGRGPGVVGCGGDVREEDACFVVCGFGKKVFYVGSQLGLCISVGVSCADACSYQPTRNS